MFQPCSATALVAGLLFACAPAVSAADDFRLRGSVSDISGGIIIGATVTIDAGQKEPRVLTTDDTGQFELDAIKRGTHRVSVEAAGFAPFEGTVAVDQPLVTFDVVLQLAISERVDVAVVAGTLGSAVGLTTATLSGKALEGLSDDPGSLVRQLQELAGATGQPEETIISVDGFTPSVRLPPKQAIQLIRISSNPFAAEFAELGRARIEIVTKPGSSAVHADVRGSVNDAAMNGRNPLAATRADDERTRDVSGYVSGPIVANRWSFVAYGGHWAMDKAQLISATGLDDQSAQPAPISTSVMTPSRVGSVWLGSDAKVGELSTLAVSFSATDDRGQNQGLESGLDLPERAYTQRTTAGELRFSLTSIASPHVLNELRVQSTARQARSEAMNDQPALLVFDAFNGGGQQDALFKQTKDLGWQVAERLTLSSGRHALKFGVDAERVSRSERDRSNFGGTFLFGADVERDTSGMPILSPGGEPIAISPFEHYRRTVLGLPGYYPSQFSISHGGDTIATNQWQYGQFAQDDWALHPRLTFAYGMRSEWQSNASGGVFGARGAVAWAVDAARRNTVRLGTGTFFQRVPADLTLDVLRFADDHQQQLQIDRPLFFPAIPADLSGAAATMRTSYTAAENLSRPQIIRFGSTFEHRLVRGGMLIAAYELQSGSRLLRMRNINAPRDDVRPFPDRGPVMQFESTARSRRHELSVGWRSKSGDRATAFANYTYTHARSETDGRTTAPADSLGMAGEYGASVESRPHQASGGFSVTTPGRIMVSTFVAATSGRAFNITSGFDANGDGLFTDRPVFAATEADGAMQTVYGWLSPAGSGEIIPRNLGREPRQVRLDLHLSRAFAVVPGASFYIAADVDNVLNSALYAGVNGVLTSPAFGTPNVALNPRRVLLSTGFSF